MFGRRPQRVVNFVGRHPQMTVERAPGILRITKQRPEPGAEPVVATDYVHTSWASVDSRQRRLRADPGRGARSNASSGPQAGQVANELIAKAWRGGGCGVPRG